VLRLQFKDKHAKFLRDLAGEVNFVWNYCNELQIAKFTRGATKERLHLLSRCSMRSLTRMTLWYNPT